MLGSTLIAVQRCNDRCSLLLSTELMFGPTYLACGYSVCSTHPPLLPRRSEAEGQVWMRNVVPVPYSVDSARSVYTPLKVVYVIKKVGGVERMTSNEPMSCRHHQNF
jgi:hypothetical protein